MRKTLLLLLALAAATACTPHESRRAVAPPHPQDGGRLVRRLESDIHTLNYLLQTTEYERYVLQYLWDPLVDLDENLRPVPGTAASWDVSDGGRVYTLHLDPRATFSDRTPVTAGDVVFTLGKLLDANAPQFASWFDSLDRAATKALDAHTVRVVFRKPYAARIYAFNIGVLPEHVYAHGDFANDFTARAVGNGPYVLTRREQGQSILLERREDYWREKPPIRSILFRVISDDAVAWQAMKRGDIDEMRVRPDVWAFEKNRPEVRDTIRFHDVYLLSYNCVPWNGRDPLFADARVRRALAMNFDTRSVIANVYRGQARALSGPFTPDQWAYDPAVPGLPYDPAGAARLLASAGWKDTDGDGLLDRNGRKFSFEVLIPSGNSPAVQQSQILQDALRKQQIEMAITTLDGATFFDRVLSGKYQAAFMSWSADPDPDPYALFHSSQIPPAGLNIVYYANPEADRLLDEARTELDPGKRVALYHRLHALLAGDQPYMWSVQVAAKWAVNRRIGNDRLSKGFGLYLWYPGPFAWRIAR